MGSATGLSGAGVRATGRVAGVRGADLLFTTGGASVADYDLIKQVLGSEGAEGVLGEPAALPRHDGEGDERLHRIDGEPDCGDLLHVRVV